MLHHSIITDDVAWREWVPFIQTMSVPWGVLQEVRPQSANIRQSQAMRPRVAVESLVDLDDTRHE
jgi:hypothetical protein